MNQFTVPQFIDREAKILGPITVRQFIISLAGVGLMVLAYRYSDFSLFLVLSIIIALVFGTFAFAKPNGRPFHYFIIAIITSKKRPGVRVWKKSYKNYKLQKPTDTAKQKKKVQAEAQLKQIKESLVKKRVARSRLSKLSLTVDTGGRYKEDKNINPKNNKNNK